MDIEKSVLLDLKGVKIIRSYRDSVFFYMISLLFARVINLIIVIVIVNTFCIVMISIYNFVENKGIFSKIWLQQLEGVAAVGVIVVLLERRAQLEYVVGPRNLVLFIGQRSVIWKKKYRECMAMGEEPPFDIEDLLRHYGSSPPNSEVSAPPSSSAPARNPLEHSTFQGKDG